MRRKIRKYRFLVLLAIAAIAATGAYAYTSAVGGVNPPRLGSGTSSIGKYALGTPVYNLNANSPQNIDSVSFTLTNATASTVVRVRLINTGGTWYSCSSAAAPTITCATTAPQVTAVGANGNTLQVVATG